MQPCLIRIGDLLVNFNQIKTVKLKAKGSECSARFEDKDKTFLAIYFLDESVLRYEHDSDEHFFMLEMVFKYVINK